MVIATNPSQVTVLTADEGKAFLEERVREALQIDLDEFIRRWQAGTYGAVDDDPTALDVAMLLPMSGVYSRRSISGRDESPWRTWWRCSSRISV